MSAAAGYRVHVADPDSDPSARAREAILELLAARGAEKTICPSEAARVLAGMADFRPYMEPVRDAAAELARTGRVEVTQKGKPVTIGEARGPIRLGLPSPRASRPA
jgi:hypothetical protein